MLLLKRCLMALLLLGLALLALPPAPVARSWPRPAAVAALSAQQAQDCADAWELVAQKRLTYLGWDLWSTVYGVDVVPSGEVWVVGDGYRTQVPGQMPQANPLVARLVAGRLELMPTPGIPAASDSFTTQLSDIFAVSDSDVWAVGSAGTANERQALILHWNGSAWSRVPAPQVGAVDRLNAIDGVAPNDIWAVGTREWDRTLLLHWDGSSWVSVPAPVEGTLRGVKALATDDVWAVGSFVLDPSSGYQPYIIHWDGSSWSFVQPFGSDVDSGELFEIDGSGPNDLWAVGAQSYRSFALRWDGTDWRRVELPASTEIDESLRAVSVAAPDDVWVTGSRSSSSAFAMHWDGGGWTRMPVPGARLSDLVRRPDGEIVGVGGPDLLIASHSPPSVRFNSEHVRVLEEAGTAALGVTLSKPSGARVDVDYTLEPLSATPGNDFSASAGRIVLPACQTSASIAVALHDDSIWEHSESLRLTLSSSDGATLATPATAQLSIIDTVDAPPANRVALPVLSSAPAPTPAPPGRIAFGSGNGYDLNQDIYVVREDGSQLQRLTHAPGWNARPAWSPDGTRIAFDSNRDGNAEIYVMQADGSQQTRLTVSPAHDTDPAWSPDGSLIVFSSNREGATLLYIMRADGSEVRQLTQPLAHGDPFDVGASWSPDGTRIVFSSYRDGGLDLYSVGLDGGPPVRLTQDDPENSGPAWSPDGTRIAFGSGAVPAWDLYTIQPDGSGLAPVSPNFSTGTDPSWSPDGSAIVYSDGYAMYIVDLAGGQPRPLSVNTGTYKYTPAWAPR